MKEAEYSELEKMLMAIIVYEREVALLYADAAKKMPHLECRRILDVASKQSKGHMESVARVYFRIVLKQTILDTETLNTLSFVKAALSRVEADSTEVLKACIDIETRMSEMYKEIAENEYLEAAFKEVLGEEEKRDLFKNIAETIMRISTEEDLHTKMFKKMLAEYPETEKKE